MRKLDPFTLIYDGTPLAEPDPAHAEAVKAEVADPLMPASGPEKSDAAADKPRSESSAQVDLYKTLESIPISDELRKTLAYTCETQNPVESDPSKLARNVAPVVKELERQDKVTTVAIWDLDARVGNLPALIKPLNKSQAELTFFELQGAPLPAGLLGTSEFMAKWIRSKINRRPSGSGEKVIGEHLNSNEFYNGASVIQQKTGVDYLIGISPFLIAGDKGDEIFWNHYSDVNGRLMLVSTNGLRERAEQAGRPVEVAIAVMLISALAVAMNRKLEYHAGSETGCLIDNNICGVNIIRTISALKIDDDCLKKFEKKNREPFIAMLDGLKNYKETKTVDVEAVDNKYWLAELDKLSKE